MGTRYNNSLKTSEPHSKRRTRKSAAKILMLACLHLHVHLRASAIKHQLQQCEHEQKRQNPIPISNEKKTIYFFREIC